MTKMAMAHERKNQVKPESKIGSVIKLLKREQGATLDELVNATGWQPHTTRAALSGLRKSGHTIKRTERDKVSCYSIVAPAKA